MILMRDNKHDFAVTWTIMSVTLLVLFGLRCITTSSACGLRGRSGLGSPLSCSKHDWDPFILPSQLLTSFSAARWSCLRTGRRITDQVLSHVPSTGLINSCGIRWLSDVELSWEPNYEAQENGIESRDAVAALKVRSVPFRSGRTKKSIFIWMKEERTAITL